MVLFSRNAITKAYLLTQRTFTSTKVNNFAYQLKSVPLNGKKLPHPEHVKSVSLWRNIFIFAGIPALILININLAFFEEHHPKREEFRPYEYMRKRSRKFPWGDGNHTLFHNEYYNALPDGYETPDDYLEKLHGGHEH